MPKNTAVPSVCRSSEPAPTAQTSGVTPRMKASDVMMIGRKPQVRGFDRGIEAVAAAVLELLGEFDDQNGVLGGKADEHDKADLGEDVVVLPAQHDAEDRGDQTHRHDHDDRKRQRQAFELRGEHQEHEDHASTKAKMAVLPARICWKASVVHS